MSKAVLHLFGLGLSPFAPGTVGSLGAAALWPLWMLLPVNYLWPLWILLATLALWCCYRHVDTRVDRDPSWVVLDEAIAVWMIPVFFQGQWSSAWLVAWVAFRLFDIAKPFPVSLAERFPHPALAIYLDDIVAVLLALWLTKFWYGC
jgi:phosphatidylglycerophosphatase A